MANDVKYTMGTMRHHHKAFAAEMVYPKLESGAEWCDKFMFSGLDV
jgi:hypothetical protein